jgi:hypothetical protein
MLQFFYVFCFRLLTESLLQVFIECSQLFFVLISAVATKSSSSPSSNSNSVEHSAVAQPADTESTAFAQIPHPLQPTDTVSNLFDLEPDE